MKNKLSGFTLVELVITIAIVIILSVVSVPIYQSYTRKAKMAEGYALLGMILSAQKSYYSEYGNFFDSIKVINWTCNDPVLGIDARGNKYFTWFNCNANGSEAKYFYHSQACHPELLDNGKTGLCLNYNITSGSTLYELP